MQKHVDQHLKFQIDVNSASSSASNGQTPSTSEAREPPLPQQQQMMPPPSNEWSNQFNSPDAEDMGPFVEQLLPFVRASAYNWFHLQAAKRRHLKEFDKRMTASEENNKLAEIENDREELKVKWTSRLLGKIKKDIKIEYKDAFVAAITGVEPDKCVLSVADHKGKIRRIDCLRQADKVWRLDLVTVILFKGIPLESTDGERLERCDSCTNSLCINPFHIAISVRGLDIFMASYLRDVDKMPIYRSKDDSPDMNRLIKVEPGESSIATPHAVLGTNASHARVWESPTNESDDVLLSYDLQKACHSYFGGRTSIVQHAVSDPYSHLESSCAVDNNYYDPKRSVLCLPPPPLQGCLSYSGSDSQPLDMSEDSNDGPVEKRRRDTPTHDSPNSSFCSTNDEVRRIVENGNSNKLVLGQSSSIWIPSTQYGRQQQHSDVSGPIRQIRPPITDFRNQELNRNTAFRSTKPVRRMTVNAGNHGDVGVVVVDERNIHDSNIHSQTIANALNSLRTTPTLMESPAGRKRIHHSAGSPFELLSGCSQETLKNIMSGSDVSPPHAAVSNLISRESSGFIASPTKFTTARGDTTSFSKIFQKIEEKHNQKHNSPSTSYCNEQMQPPLLSSKPVESSSVKLIAPVALKPSMIPGSIITSPIITPRVTPFPTSEDSLLKVLGLTANSNDGSLIADLAKFIDSNSRSPLLNGPSSSTATTFPAFPTGNGNQSGPSRSDNSVMNANQLGGSMGLIVPSGISIAVSQTPTKMTPIHQMPIGIRVHSSDSPGSSNEGAANQAPVSDAPTDPNAPKLPTDFSQALLDEKS